MRSIDRYGAIGDGRSVALISDTGAIDWLCWPRIDSPAIFAALLDDERGGRFAITPLEPFVTHRRYVEGSNVLVTELRTTSGAIELIDWMPAYDDTPARVLRPERELLRRVRCLRGTVAFDIVVDPRPDFGLVIAEAKRAGPLGVRWDMREGPLRLQSDVRLELAGSRAFARCVLDAGARFDLSLSHSVDAPAVVPSLGPRVDDLLAGTATWWRRWSARVDDLGRHHDVVVRSALALKLLCFSPSGGIVAAPTTSLPERIGAAHNWDYRFCWLRDAALTVRALFGVGYVEEAEAFVAWLLHTTRLTWPRLHVLYDVFGRKPPLERTLDHLAGYQGSRPIRVGNAAMQQLQLDLYGEVIDATAQVARKRGHIDRETRALLCGLADEVTRRWDSPDQGIWEPRTPPAHHTHSRLLCWVALDRMLGLEDDGLIVLRNRKLYQQVRAAIRRDIEEWAFNPTLGAYVGILDSDMLDASVLLMSTYGFEAADSPRMRSTHARLRAHLGTSKGMRRFRRAPGDEEGAFGICGFWEVDHLARAGEHRRAEALYVTLCGTANDLGLFAEEVDPETGALLGNFPQAFTHVGAINAAITLEDTRPRRSRPSRPNARPREVLR